MEPDFSGYATKAGLKCSDGRIITPEAFKHMDGKKVPLVWKHGHDSPNNVLGYAVLEAREDGVYAKGFFNETQAGQSAKQLVTHGDIEAMSIYANQLTEKAVKGVKSVLHGVIREVSLVISGANPGALIDYVRIQHSSDPDDVTELEDEAIIHTGLPIERPDPVDEEGDVEVEDDLLHAEAKKTLQDIIDTLNEEQREAVAFLIGTVAEGQGTAEQSEEKTEDDLEHQEGQGEMTRNVFEQNKKVVEEGDKKFLSHDEMQGILEQAKKIGSVKEAVEEFALKHGITNIDVLFPDARALDNRPELDSRRMQWVAPVLGATRKTPFSRIKSVVADMTADEARAKGYITGEFKKEQWFSVAKRTTGPTTIYKKQKLDRDDMVDITDFDVVAFLKWELRFMLEEEIARAILIGDGRDAEDEDKIKDPAGSTDGLGIRSILNDHELYAATINVNIGDASSSYMEVVESVLRARTYYKGSGNPNFYTTNAVVVEMLLTKDTNGRRFWNNKAELANALMVNEIVEVEPMEELTDLIGIIVNLGDYNVGADKGGEVNMFDDFDIDYNQYKYLIETRVPGALTKIRSALVIKKTTGTNLLVDPNSPTFVEGTGVVTIPSQTGVVYKNDVSNATLSSGAQSALAAGATLKVRAEPASGYYFAANMNDQWSFTRPAA